MPPYGRKGVFPLNIKTQILSSILALGSLSACNIDDHARNERYENPDQISYFHEENEGKDKTGYGGNYFNRSDGMITRIMDREGEAGGDEFPTKRYADYNYSGHVDSLEQKARSSYYHEYEGALAEKITRRVLRIDGVGDARTVVYHNRVLVAVHTDAKDKNLIKTKAENIARKLAKDKKADAVTDDATFARVRNIDNDLRNGLSTGEVNEDIRDMFDGSDAVTD